MDKIRRIALVGNGATTRASDGFDGEIWTTASVAKILPRVDRVFEVHKEYDAARLNKSDAVIMVDGYKEDIKYSEDLDIDNLVNKYGPIFQFSFDYMMAYALETNARGNEHIEITTYGIDLATNDEYNQFRQSFYYWVGLLRGSGIKVNISTGSAIFSEDWQYCHKSDLRLERVKERIALIDNKLAEAKEQLDMAASRADRLNGYRECLDDLSRLGVL